MNKIVEQPLIVESEKAAENNLNAKKTNKGRRSVLVSILMDMVNFIKRVNVLNIASSCLI